MTYQDPGGPSGAHQQNPSAPPYQPAASSQNTAHYYTQHPVPNGDPGPARKTNVLGLISLGIAVIGFVFACIPGLLIIGWILLPIAFILSIVSLFLRGAKWPGLTGLILSIIGTVVGVIVFVFALGSALDTALGGSDSVVIQPDAGQQPSDADGATGTRENPAAIGSQITGKEWTVTVNSFTADGNDVVAQANQFNEAPPAGSHYSIVNYTVTYTGEESGFAPEVGVSLVTSTGEVLDNYDAMVLLSDSIGIEELYKGGTSTGSAAFTVPDGADVLIRIRPGIVGDQVFIKP